MISRNLTGRGLALLALVHVAVSAATLQAEETNGVQEQADLLFYCSFDGTIQPDVQKGEKGSQAIGLQEYVPGVKGQALLTGHARSATYPLKGNLNVSAGTIKFWVRPIDWQVGDGLFHHFFRIVDEKPPQQKEARGFDLILYKFGEWDDLLAFGLSGELTSSNILRLPMTPLWRPKRWHQVVFTWDRQGASLYVDGQGKHQRYLGGAPDALFAENFIVGGPYFVENDTRTAIDELTLYNRKLSEQEIHDLYRTELIESVMLREQPPK